MLNIIIPMAGAGSRFAKSGYTVPKPLIKINTVPMIQLVIANLRPIKPHRFIFICQQKHIESYDLLNLLNQNAPGCKIIGINGLTEGAACTVLAAKELIDNDNELMIANSDQFILTNINEYLQNITKSSLDGLIMTMKASDPKWSFVELDSSNKLAKRIVEKEVISDEATVGIYNFRFGKDFVKAAETMIKQNLRVNNEFYIAPTYNQLIQNGKHIGVFNIGEINKNMFGLGVPSDLEFFLNHSILQVP